MVQGFALNDERLMKELNRKLLGYYHYYGASNSGRMMYNFRQRTRELLFKVLK